ncbi:cysteine desulfurase family protein, partial [Stieleria sp.]|uniref:cysteine desulfurase family protein n=1 Tax=Stieleria sp. TaxID=2795976 RepID=UPI003568214E
MIYLDNNATTAIDPQVAEVIAAEFQRGPANPSSQHAIGRSSSDRLDDAILRIGACLGSDLSLPGGARLITTSGGTESNNLALAGLAAPDSPLIVSSIEHASVIAFAEQAKKSGRQVHVLPVTPDGVVRIDALQQTLAELDADQAVVSVMSANNETGVVQPIAEVAEICRQAGALLHVDATQSIGKLPATVNEIPAAAITVTPHKFHGPAGVGA